VSGIVRRLAIRYGPPGICAIAVAGAGLLGIHVMAQHGLGHRFDQALAVVAVAVSAAGGAVLVTVWNARQRGLVDLAAAHRRVVAVEAARTEMERLVSGLPVAVYQGDVTPDGDYSHRFLTSGISRVTGWTVAEIPDYPTYLALVAPEDRQIADAHYKYAARDGQAVADYRLRRPDGSLGWVRQQTRVVTSHGGAAEVIGTLSDITTEHALVEQIVTSEARFRGFLNASPDAMVIADESGHIVMASQRVETLFGYNPDTIVGKPLRILVPERHRHGHAAQERMYFAAPRVRPMGVGKTLLGLHANGTEFPVEISLSPYLAPDGLFVIAVVRDITQRTQAEEQLRQAQKMEAVGQLTGGIAHDFNNMLTSILGNVELLEWGDKTHDTETAALIAAIRRSSQRASLLTQQLLAFSRKQPLRPAVTSLNVLIGGMSDLLRRTLGEHIVVEVDMAEGLWNTHVDGNQFENALLNVAINARDAMPDGGTLTIQTANAMLEDHYADANSDVRTGPYVMIAISDTGSGMTEETLRCAFDPFYTTKRLGYGTGLGLSQVYGFVRQSGGHVKLYSEIGTGSTVRIYLPRHWADREPEPRPATVNEQPPPGGSETVLVVEDDEAVRGFSTDALTYLGYNVLSADCASAAMTMLEREPEIKLLFTDIGLPGTNGLQLADDALRLRPHLKVLYATGYAPTAAANSKVSERGMHLLSKPYTIDGIARQVRAVLDEQ
jgi:PAS domain S-box-containing protein